MHITSRAVGFCLVLFCSLSLARAEGSHPAQGCIPENVPINYADRPIPESWSMGDLTFIAKENYPPAESLAVEEVYMLAGARQTTLGHGMGPWITQTFSLANAYHQRFGELPEALDRQAYVAMFGEESTENDEFACLANPISGTYARLDAVEFSPGDLYMRSLSEAEKKHFSKLLDNNDPNQYTQKLWADGNVGDREVLGQVYYLRVYGLSGVIWNGFMYSTLEPAS